jgi:hypothetical protein
VTIVGEQPGAVAHPCRACGAEPLVEVLDLGDTPVADILLTEAQLDEPDPTFRLQVGFCPECALLQLVDLIDPEILYGGDYPYFSSVVPGLVDHFRSSAEEILASHSWSPDSLVVEAASNDGYMLRVFADAGVSVLGVDPARGPADAAEAAGVTTIVDFFTSALAAELRAGGTRADVLLGNNVLNLVPDPNDFAAAVDLLLADEGEAVLEVPYAVDAVTRCEYDNFFHQNCSYFSLTALVALFGRHDLTVRDVRRVPTFGGSLRVWLGRGGASSPAVNSLLADEAALGVGDDRFYRDFAARARRSRDLLVAFLAEQRRQGKRTVAYGAAGGMATTLLSFAGVDRSVIDYAVDVNRHKHGLYTPGSRLKVFPPERLLDDRPDFVLLLAWNYEAEILAANDEYRRGGGTFVIPIPEPRTVGATTHHTTLEDA